MSKSSRKSHKSRKSSRARRTRPRSKRTILVLTVVALAALGYLLIPRNAAPEVSAARLEDNPSLGSADARVVVTEFGDFTCSACKSWHQAGVIEQLLAQYGDDLRVEWRDFPIITADSPRAAQAGQCAYDQGLFWEFLDRVYSEPGLSYTNAGESDLRRYAEEIGLDMQAFNACLDSNQHHRTVVYDLKAAQALRLRGTPAFLVNGKPVIGANPQLLAQAIEAALQE